MQTRTFEGIDTVDPAVWQRIAQAYPYAGAEWWRFAESVHGAPGLYLIVEDGDQPVAGAAFSVIRREHLPIENRAARALVERFMDRWPLLVCRTAPLTRHQALMLPTDSTVAQRALDAIQLSALDLARQHSASFVLFDYLDLPTLSLSWRMMLPQQDTMESGTRLEIEWDSFEGYVESRSSSIRRYIRRHSKQAIERGIEVLVGPQTATIDEMLPLIANVERTYHQAPFPYTRQVLECAAHMEGTSWVAARHNGKLVTCGLLLFDRASRVCIPVLYGRDYDVEDAYFYAYFEVLRHVIEVLRARTLIGESGAYDFKQKVGFGPDARNNLTFASPSRLMMSLARRFT